MTNKTNRSEGNGIAVLADNPPRNPGDEASPGSPQTGEHLCPDCGGSGRLQGEPCRTCGGTGRIIAIVGDA
jgi:DnaJ-class molecular chaperone with C-terminal Zn finger domain